MVSREHNLVLFIRMRFFCWRMRQEFAKGSDPYGHRGLTPLQIQLIIRQYIKGEVSYGNL
ncbi:hypothetical protein CLOHYLEM_07008 [[Clostridium] hylemonae DSM 15053]|uniref:Uncharacterized protein n=1 Tax=[Clostridium] hylemonae DSM 15053 TaxID=553973 RepID=C0C4J2_9FIRM|nr:hypothetical protein CLOHYLEM_07008 [[Clostridium] hylemonae DSM 15053]